MNSQLQYVPYELVRKWPIRGLNRSMAICQSHDSGHMRKMAKTLFSEMSKEDHARLSLKWGDELKRLEEQWIGIVNREFFSRYHRRFSAYDYQVSGVARSEFDEQTKAQLRAICHKQVVASAARAAHALAASKSVMSKFKGVQ